jgi:xanthine dehydrogenase/oxidase
MPRHQNAHAIVNAGKPNNTIRSSRIVYCGLKPPYTRARDTERFLVGKNLFSNETLQGAIKVLQQEIVAIENLPEPPAEYRKQLAIALFYKVGFETMYGIACLKLKH